MTLTLTPDPDLNPKPISIPHLYSAFRNSSFHQNPSLAGIFQFRRIPFRRIQFLTLTLTLTLTVTRNPNKCVMG